MITKQQIEAVIHEKIGRIIVDYRTVNPDVLSSDEVDSLVEGLYRLVTEEDSNAPD